MEFHIKCDPSEIARYVFAPGDQARAEKIAKHFDDYHLVTLSRGYSVYSGTYKGVHMTACGMGMGGPTLAIGMHELANMGADIRRGNESAEDIMVYMRNDVFATLQVLLQGQQRFESAALADIGFDNIVWDNMTFVRDEMAPANTMFFINHNHMYAAIRNSANFEFLGFEKEDDSVVGHVIVDINLVCDDPHRQGKITDITTV